MWITPCENSRCTYLLTLCFKWFVGDHKISAFHGIFAEPEHLGLTTILGLPSPHPPQTVHASECLS